MAPTRPPSSPSGSGAGLTVSADDFLDGPIPDPEAAASATERAHAASFAELIDKAIAGRTPPALSTDERALLEVTTVIRATGGHAELGAGQRRALVEDALTAALGAREQGPARLSVPMQIPQARARSWLPWGLAGVSAAIAIAALVLLWMRPSHAIVVSRPAPPPTYWTSRPADGLVGEITRDTAANAAARIDSIYSDRLDGYRDATLFRGGAR